MLDIDRFKAVHDAGAPVLYLRELARTLGSPGEEERVIARAHRTILQTDGSWIRVPPGVSDIRHIEATIGRTFEPYEPSEGVYALATTLLPGRLGRQGVVRRVTLKMGPLGTEDDHAHGCRLGLDAARGWIIQRAGHGVRLSRAGVELSEAAPYGRTTAGGWNNEGRSCGLAAALAFTWNVVCATPSLRNHLPQNPFFVAATGEVDGGGRVRSVAGVREKLRGLERETPFVKTVYVPSDVRTAPKEDQRLRVVPVSHVAEALADAFGSVPFETLEVLSPARAIERAQRLEREQWHREAEHLARVVLAELESNGPINADTKKSRVRPALGALRLVALNESHVGRSHTALRRLHQHDEILSTLSERDRRLVLSPEDDVHLAATVTPLLLGLFRPYEALAHCERANARFTDADALARVSLLGSWATALAAAGRWGDALAKSDEQLEHAAEHLDDERQDEWPRMYSTQFDVRLRSTQANALPFTPRQLEHSLAKIESHNRTVTGRARSQNHTFLTLHRIRFAAWRKDLATAVALLPELPEAATGFYPLHHVHRYYGETLAAVGRLDEALTHLDAAVDTISPHGGPVMRATLLAAAARAALLRIEDARPGWRRHATAFRDAIEAVNPNAFEQDRPTRDASTDRWTAWLERVLRALPY